MTVGNLLDELVKYDKSNKILIYPELLEFDDEDNLVGTYAGGISVCTGTNHYYLGDADFAQEVEDEDDDIGFDLDELDDDELDIDLEFEEERLN